MFTNAVTTVAGILMALGGLPLAVLAFQVSYPTVTIPSWWAPCQFPLVLCFLLGSLLLGKAAKGIDTHSIPAQVQAAGRAAIAVTPVQVAAAKVEVAQADQAAKKP
jgi:TRAP-type C4-dicarboxylate transport system permease small subunit